MPTKSTKPTTAEALFQSGRDCIAQAQADTTAGRHADARDKLHRAFRCYRGAAALLYSQYAKEPTRGLVHLHAANLAAILGEWPEAKRLATNGLAGNPAPAVADELRQLAALAVSNKREAV